MTSLPIDIPVPDLLIRPHPHRNEGPQGYLLRLAEANFMTPRNLGELGISFDVGVLHRQRLMPAPALDPDLHAHVRRVGRLFQEMRCIWNQQHARFCPRCLAEDPTWQASWELLFFDVCPRHGLWLVDQCSSCGKALGWGRDSLLRCSCGSDLRQERAEGAPWFDSLLAERLENRLLNKEDSIVLGTYPFADLNLEQLQRLIRYAGSYLDPARGPKPLKIHHAGAMEVSWPVTSLAAEILFDWPRAFYATLDQLQEAAPEHTFGLKGKFDQAYSYPYHALREPAFAPLRKAFEIWVSESWKGGTAKRNRRLSHDLLANMQWIPGKAAADRLGISMPYLRHLIHEGELEGQESVKASGRRFIMVRKDQLYAMDEKLANEITMKKAMEILGIGKVRLQRILMLLFPSARRLQDKIYMPWCIPRGEVMTLAEVGLELPLLTALEENQVSFAHVLQYWNWNADEIVSLVEAVKFGRMPPLARLDGAVGIGRWVFNREQLRVWHHNLETGRVNWISIPELATVLGVKQQVAYWLTQNSYIRSEKLGTVKGIGSRIKKVEVERFLREYIFATEIADRIGRSPRKVMHMLRELSIYPLRGNSSAEPCRQLVYRRSTALDGFIQRHEVALPDSHETRAQKRKNAWDRIIWSYETKPPDVSDFKLESP
ncbi:TniQ protein [Formivibrio citricus]|uniref:TniQ protein n=1 Tax=Formivibrio citricus TaxID=83765 RepID=A0A1I5CUY6_9NEIS|nr:TniQ family protein [Formivibrio citricus]SFN90743.1 TniQ protein [Formivibrio citricus]